MKTIQKCDDTVFEGAPVQWEGSTLTILSDGPCVGLAGRPFVASLDVNTEVLVTELTLHGPSRAIVASSVPRNGGALYLTPLGLSTMGSGSPFAFAMPADIGNEADYDAGSLIDVVIY